MDETTGLRLIEPLLRTMAGGDGAEFVVTTRVLGGGSVWLPFANAAVDGAAGCVWRDNGAELGAVTAMLWPCPAFWTCEWPWVP